MSGLFITFEGGEGLASQPRLGGWKTGFQKWPQIELVRTREPGGTPESEQIRDILVNGQADKLSPAQKPC